MQNTKNTKNTKSTENTKLSSKTDTVVPQPTGSKKARSKRTRSEKADADPAPSVARWQPGKAYLIRTVTHYVVGRLLDVEAHELWLDQAAWVADTGRFSAALQQGVLREVEPFPDGAVAVGRGAIVDAALWRHPLPRTVK